jgi:integrase
VEATLPFLPPVVADMVRIQRLTGARPGEICQMRPCDIEKGADVWKYRPEDHTTKHLDHDRVIFIGSKARRLLRPYLSRDPESYCFSPTESEQRRREEGHQRRKAPLQRGNRPGSNRKPARTRPAGGRYTNDSYRRAIHRACELAFDMPAELRCIDKNQPPERMAELL